jgi:hypothetical protein
MKYFLALILSVLCFTAQAQSTTPSPLPDCFPANVGGVGTSFVQGATYEIAGATVEGEWLGWWCPKNDGTENWKSYAIVSVPNYVIKHPPFTPSVLDMFKAYWRLNVMEPDDSPEQTQLRAIARTELEKTRPPTVTPNPNPVWLTLGTTSYNSSNGSLSSFAGLIKTGRVCDCDPRTGLGFKLAVGSAIYCPFDGAAKPTIVAQCKPK